MFFKWNLLSCDTKLEHFSLQNSKFILVEASTRDLTWVKCEDLHFDAVAKNYRPWLPYTEVIMLP